MYRFLFFSHLFVGLGAIGGGMGAILNPQGPMGISVELLENSPFSNYFIPGIILFTVIGLGGVISALTIGFKYKYRIYISIFFSWGLVIWIVVQCIMLNTINILHVLYFIIGLIEASLSMVLLFKEGLYPADYALGVYKKFKKEI